MVQRTPTSEESETNPVFRFGEQIERSSGVVTYQFEFNTDTTTTGAAYDTDEVLINYNPATSQFQATYLGIGGEAQLQTEVNGRTLIVHHIPYFWNGAYEALAHYALYINITKLTAGGYAEGDMAAYVLDTTDPAHHHTMLAGACAGSSSSI